MSSSDRGPGDTPGPHHEPATNANPPGTLDPAQGDAHWLDRMQRARARHAAITKNLYTWSSYKNWADRMRDTWEDQDADTKSSNPGTLAKPVLPRR